MYLMYVNSEAIFTHFGSIFETRSQRFNFSARSLGYVIVSFVEIAQEAATVSRTGAVGIPASWATSASQTKVSSCKTETS